ncbi:MULTISPECIES: DoxX family membrane protein [Glaesserella]|uniref:DoxX family protein n=1 Tax=Glaesserella australis TaxID=2094024 RepID=A0A328BXV7_9PAST|nr:MULTISPECIES: DoxX family membrane protein [Glaesserella]AUI66003.1 DoxX family protein [Glaesserella sp. 15-184]RAL18277.1 DoxX family protein [Glaesserella australis]
MILGYFKLFLRFSVATSMISAIADRFNLWSPEMTVWGTMDAFIQYATPAMFYIPDPLMPAAAWFATIVELIAAITLLLGFKTELSAKISGIVLAVFALSMTFSFGIKSVFDYSVFNATAAAFSILLIKEKFLELDSLFDAKKGNHQ